MDLPRPGIIGILIRLTLGALVLWMGFGALADSKSFWDGFDEPAASLPYLASVTLFTSWVVNELLQRSWKQRPVLIALGGLAAAVGVGAVGGDPFGPLYGTYLWVWVVLFTLLLGPAHLLAALLRTPGCEMRSYAHLWARLRGREVDAVVCPGWIDRLDGVRISGRR